MDNNIALRHIDDTAPSLKFQFRAWVVLKNRMTKKSLVLPQANIFKELTGCFASEKIHGVNITNKDQGKIYLFPTWTSKLHHTITETNILTIAKEEINFGHVFHETFNFQTTPFVFMFLINNLLLICDNCSFGFIFTMSTQTSTKLLGDQIWSKKYNRT